MNEDGSLKPIEKAWHWTGYVTMFIGMFFLVWFIWSTLAPVKVIEVKDETFPIVSSPVVVGEDVSFIIDYCKYSNRESRVTKNLIGKENGVIIPLQSSTTRLPLGCEMVAHSHKIPPNTPAGIYHIEIHLTYTINLYRDLDHTFFTEEFEVIESEVN